MGTCSSQACCLQNLSAEELALSAQTPVIEYAAQNTGEDEELPSCPLDGCSLSFLETCVAEWSLNFKAKPSGSEQEFTMGSVCNEIIRPASRKAGLGLQGALQAVQWRCANGRPPSVETSTPTESLSFAELAMMEELLDARGQPAFAKATHFVSHAWRYQFGDFVMAVRNWVESSGTSEDGTYFWVDAFVVNQNKAQSYPQEWWSSRFMEAVGEIGNTILVLDPWEDPVPFKRAWVVWELYCTSVTGAQLHIAMRPEAKADFNNTLVTSFEKVQTALSSIDVASSEAFHASDQAMIHTEIQRTIGFAELNELIPTRLSQWLIEAAKARLKILVDEEERSVDGRRNSLGSKDHDTQRINLADNLARMLRETGNVAEAEANFEELLEEVKDALGENHLFVLSCMNQLAVTYQKSGKIEEATQMHRQCLQHRVKVLGPLHADSLQSTSNLAVLLSSQLPLTEEEFEEAQALFRQAVSGREAGSGPDHPTTLYTVSNLGKLLSGAPYPTVAIFDEAEALHQRAVDRLTAILFDSHPLTLTAMHNQACHWLSRFQYEDRTSDAPPDWDLIGKCAAQLHNVHKMRTEKLGKQHPETSLTETALVTCSGLLGAPCGIAIRAKISNAEIAC